LGQLITAGIEPWSRGKHTWTNHSANSALLFIKSLIKIFRLDENLKNLDKYESWQQKSDDLKEKLDETKDNLDKFGTPTSDVEEREKQKRFLNVSCFLSFCLISLRKVG
jgi:hypothetical protein